MPSLERGPTMQSTFRNCAGVGLASVLSVTVAMGQNAAQTRRPASGPSLRRIHQIALDGHWIGSGLGRGFANQSNRNGLHGSDCSFFRNQHPAIAFRPGGRSPRSAPLARRGTTPGRLEPRDQDRGAWTFISGRERHELRRELRGRAFTLFRRARLRSPLRSRI